MGGDLLNHHQAFNLFGQNDRGAPRFFESLAKVFTVWLAYPKEPKGGGKRGEEGSDVPDEEAM